MFNTIGWAGTNLWDLVSLKASKFFCKVGLCRKMVGNFILHYSELFLQWLEIHQKHSIITCPKPSFANRLAHRLAPFGICSFHSINVTFVYFRLNIVMVFKIVCRMGRHWFSLDICSSHHRSRYRLRQLPLRTLRLNVPWSFRAVWCFCRQDPWGRWKIHGLWRIGILYRCACNVENTATQQNWIRRACNNTCYTSRTCFSS